VYECVNEYFMLLVTELSVLTYWVVMQCETVVSRCMFDCCRPLGDNNSVLLSEKKKLQLTCLPQDIKMDIHIADQPSSTLTLRQFHGA